jgi:hypothetical protein
MNSCSTCATSIIVVLFFSVFITTPAADEVPLDCRTHPEWLGDVMRATCQEATKYQQRAPFWINMTDYWAKKEGANKEIKACLQQTYSSWRLLRDLNILRPSDTSIKEQINPSVIGSYQNNKGMTILVQVGNALTEEEAFGVQALAGCVRKVQPENLEDRGFASGGGNLCTFLSFWLQRILPGVAAQLEKVATVAFEFAKWNEYEYHEKPYPLPNKLGIRTTEHLDYGTFVGGLGSHADAGSVYTVLTALSNPNHYEGGEYYLDLEDGAEVLFKPMHRSAIVFLSDQLHGVRPIPRGRRETFATEFWVYSDVPIGANRPHQISWEVYEHKKRTEGPDAGHAKYEEIREFHSQSKSEWDENDLNDFLQGAKKYDQPDIKEIDEL